MMLKIMSVMLVLVFVLVRFTFTFTFYLKNNIDDNFILVASHKLIISKNMKIITFYFLF
jgi:hypothetical protein